MAKTIQIKRGAKSTMPTLAQGEFGFVTDSNAEELYIGAGSQNIQIARQDYVETKASADSVIALEARVATAENLIETKSDIPDWNQNDEASSGYVKNRPFYSEPVTLVDTTLEIDPNDGTGVLPDPIGLIGGQTYTVTWNGTEHVCVAQAIVDGGIQGLALGDIGMMTGGASTGEPFIIAEVPPEVAVEMGMSGIVQPLDDSESVTLVIVGETIKTIDSKYLPEHLQFGTVIRDILPECQLVGLDEDEDGTIDGFLLTQELDLTVGETYTVNYNGMEYSCMAQDLSDVAGGIPAVGLGDIGAMMGGTSTGEPFVIQYCPEMFAAQGVEGVTGAVVVTDGTESVTLSIKKETIKTIDPKYLPDDIGSGGGVKHWDELEGRPFYSEKKILVDTTLECDSDGNMPGLTEPIGLVVGQEYAVTWNGVEYICTAQVIDAEGVPTVVMGDFGMMLGGNSTGEPFLIGEVPADLVDTLGMYAQVVALDGSTSVTLSISCEGVKTLDSKYLPEHLQFGSESEDLCEFTVEFQNEMMELPVELNLVSEQTYIVNWNGVEYECVAQTFISPEDPSMSAVVLGNMGMMMGGASTGEPFIILTGAESGIACLTGEISATVSIASKITKHIDTKYLEPFVVDEGVPAGIVLPPVELECSLSNYIPGCQVEAGLNLKDGVTYIVTIDGVQYESVCWAASLMGMEMLILGNSAMLDLPIEGGSGEFCIATVPGLATLLSAPVSSNNSGSEYHTFSIRTDGTPDKIKLKNEYLDVEWYAGQTLEVEIMPESVGNNGTSGSDDTFGPLPVDRINSGDIIVVYYDGKRYECPAIRDLDAVAVGNAAYIGAGSNTGEPFLFVYESPDPGSRLYAMDGGDHTVSMYLQEPVKIPEKFLPESFNSGGGNVDFTETDPTVPDWAKQPEKPKYTAEEVGALPSTFTETDPTVPDWAKQPNKPAYAVSEIEGAAPIADPVFTGSIRLGNTTGAGVNSVLLSIHGQASGNYSFASGYFVKALGSCSHSEGEYTTASGSDAHAEGFYTTASGASSHAEGVNTTAQGNYSHTEGARTIALGQCQHVQGEYNIESSTLAHIVGNGKPENPSNAHTLDWDGNAWFAGNVYVGSTSGTDRDEGSKKLATEEYVTTAISNIEIPDGDFPVVSVNSKTGAVVLNAGDVGAATADHTHTEYATTASLDAKADKNHTHTEYATTNHTHEISNITNLEATLNSKAESGHTHPIVDNTTGVSYNLSVDNGVLSHDIAGEYTEFTLTSANASNIGYTNETTDLVIPSAFVKNGVTYKVVGISSYAFHGHTNLTSVIIPDSVTSIVTYAFNGCSNLTSVTIGNGVINIGDYVFRNCTGLTNITIPNSVTSIGNGVFHSCNNLTNITIPNNVTSIGTGAFQNCTNLTTVYYTGTEEEWNDIDIGTSNTPLTNANIIYNYTGEKQDKLIGMTGQLVGFDENNNAVAVNKPVYTADEVGAATANHTHTEYATENHTHPIVDNTTGVSYELNIDNGTLSYDIAGSYTEFTVSSSNRIDIGYTDETTELIIPSAFVKNGVTHKVTSIGNSAFSGCTSLTSIAIPDSVTSIAKYAFSDCTSLSSVTIPNSISNIAQWTFYNCTNLTSVTIPDSVTSIGINAFHSCTILTTIYYTGTEEEWNNIAISSGNNPLVNANIIYNYTGEKQDKLIGASGQLVGFDENGNAVAVNKPVYTADDVGAATANHTHTEYADKNHTHTASEIGAATADHVHEEYADKTHTHEEYLTSFTETDPTVPAWAKEATKPSYTADEVGAATADHIHPIVDDATGVSYELSVDNGVLSHDIAGSYTEFIIKSTNRADIGYTDETTDLVIPSAFVKDGQTYKVTRINNGAFYNCTNLTSITIPDSVTIIELQAFRNCANLISVTIPYGVTSIGMQAFDGCTNLTSVTIPDSVTSIGDDVFYNCTGLTNITIPDGVTSIGRNMFSRCVNLTSITIPDSVISIDNNAFSGCTSLTSITIPDSVTSIGDDVFWGCDGLTSVTIPDGVTSIGNSAFYNCTNLTSITIPDSVTSIGRQAFWDCAGLTSITIPNSVTSIGNSAFRGCTNLITVYYTGTEEEWNNITIDSGNNPLVNANIIYNYTGDKQDKLIGVVGQLVGFDNDGNAVAVDKPTYTAEEVGAATADHTHPIVDDTTGISYELSVDNGVLSHDIAGSYTEFTINSSNRADIGYTDETTDLVIPSAFIKNGVVYKVTSINNFAFRDCTNLTSITIPNSVTSIGESAFEECTNLTSITIPDSITSISVNAFNDCTNLTSITIPDSVTSIENGAFRDCTGLSSITIPDSVTSIGNGAFSGCTGLSSITIPNSVTSIGKQAFSGCSNLTIVTIPNSVTSIGDGAFQDCTSLINITISDSITSIGVNAFYGCTNLTSVVIPNSVTSIDNQAFCNCTNLTSVVIPNSVTSIVDKAFYFCTNLTTVYFSGTEEEWNNISIGTYNNKLTNANIIYEYTDDIIEAPALILTDTSTGKKYKVVVTNGELNVVAIT